MTITNETAIEPAPGAIVDRAPRGGLGDLRQIIGQLDAARAELVAAGRRDDLAVGLAQLRTLLADLRILANAVEDDVVALLGDDRAADVAGLGRIERKRGTDRRAWDWDLLLPRLIRLALDPDDTGEIGTAADVVQEMRALLVDVIGLTPSRGPRVTPLRAMGLDPDEWCETKPGRTTVQIHGEAV